MRAVIGSFVPDNHSFNTVFSLPIAITTRLWQFVSTGVVVLASTSFVGDRCVL